MVKKKYFCLGLHRVTKQGNRVPKWLYFDTLTLLCCMILALIFTIPLYLWPCFVVVDPLNISSQVEHQTQSNPYTLIFADLFWECSKILALIYAIHFVNWIHYSITKRGTICTSATILIVLKSWLRIFFGFYTNSTSVSQYAMWT